MNPAEAIQEDYEFREGVDVDVVCPNCLTPSVVRFRKGEPVDQSGMVCWCGEGLGVV